MSFAVLPNEILEKIAGFLDTTTLAAFSQVSRRCQDAVHRLVASLQFIDFNSDIEGLLKYYGSNVRTLDISNCQATSCQLESLILKCPNLERLSIVNTRLTIRGVLSVTQALRRLEAIHFGLPTAIDLSQRDFPLNEHIKRVYIEVPPIDFYYFYAIDLINTCVRLEWLHVFVVDRLLPPAFNSRHSMARARSGFLFEERWQTLHTLIVSSEARDSSQRLLILIPSLFQTCPLQYNSTVLASAIAEFKTVVFERGRCNLVLTYRQANHDELESTEDVHLLRHVQKSVSILLEMDALQRSIQLPNWGQPQGLALSFHPTCQYFPSHCLSKLLTKHLTELNLTKCHWRFPETSWWQLMVAVPALQALAIPACMLPSISNGSGTKQNNSSNPRLDLATTAFRTRNAKRFRVAPSTADGDCAVIIALSELPLKQLYIRGDQCRSCMVNENRSRRLGKISELARLESLTLKCVPLAGALLESLWSPTVITLKIISVGNKSSCEYLCGFRRFIERCRSLQHLKLEHDNLMLGSVLLWEGLAHAAQLNQLCLASSSTDRVDLSAIAKYLMPIKRNFRYLHIHARSSNYRQVSTIYFLVCYLCIYIKPIIEICKPWDNLLLPKWVRKLYAIVYILFESEQLMHRMVTAVPQPLT